MIEKRNQSDVGVMAHNWFSSFLKQGKLYVSINETDAGLTHTHESVISYFCKWLIMQ